MESKRENPRLILEGFRKSGKDGERDVAEMQRFAETTMPKTGGTAKQIQGYEAVDKEPPAQVLTFVQYTRKTGTLLEYGVKDPGGNFIPLASYTIPS